jgi:hypothetical protein
MVRTTFKTITLFVACWTLIFVCLVGTDLSLIPQYFWLGITGQGLEQVSFVWLIALAAFAVIGGIFLISKTYLRRKTRKTAA